ncbi:MAG: SufE family protein [Microbacterium sp.]
MSDHQLPPSLASFRDELLALPGSDRLELLAEIGDELPALPQRYVDHPELTERVTECRSPVFIAVEVEGGIATMHATVPQAAPTTRGFASILVQGLTGLSVDEVRAVPADYPQRLGLADVVSPLRLNGMAGMLTRVQRRVSTS